MTTSGPPWIPGPIEAPGGVVCLRLEEAADEAFLKALFRSSAASLAGLSPMLAEPLLDMQFQSQARSYRSAYPGASNAVLERDGKPLGRLLIEAGDPALVVDYALMVDVRHGGVGRAVLSAVLDRMGVVTRANVFSNNLACLAMCTRIGFQSIAEDLPYIRLEWRPPGKRA